MTSGQDKNGNASLPMGKEAWVGFSEGVVERLSVTVGSLPKEHQGFGAHVRALRHRRGLSLGQVAAYMGVPVEQAVLLEEGLFSPADLDNAAWVRLMRLLDGADAPTESPLPQAEASPPAQQDHLEEQVHVPKTTAKDNKGGLNIGVARIKVIGVGGGGSNAVARMFRQRVPGVEYAVVNTDQQHLTHLEVPVKIRIGDELTRGLGVGGNPEVGRLAAFESKDALEELVADTDMVFIACGMGGGTGTGAAPVIAEIAQASGALTMAAVTKPFNFEGRRRMRQAEEGIERMRQFVDTLLVIPNDRLSNLSGREMTAENAFRMADDVLRQGVQSVTELITVPGEINLDFADVQAVMRGAGLAWMAIGYGRGQDRAVDAAKAALESPLLDLPVDGATRVLLNIAGGEDLTLHEVHRASDYISKTVDPEANIIFGMVTDARMDDEVRVTVIATGLRKNEEMFNETITKIIENQAEDGGDGVSGTLPEPPAPATENPSPPQEEKQGFWGRLGFGRKKQ